MRGHVDLKVEKSPEMCYNDRNCLDNRGPCGRTPELFAGFIRAKADIVAGRSDLILRKSFGNYFLKKLWNIFLERL